MKFKITYQGKRDYINVEWPHFSWLVEINGVSFHYKTGLGHATPKLKTNRHGCYNGYNKKPNIDCIPIESEWVHVPNQDDVLECLFSDAVAGSESFNAFCDNFGYSSDSLKALDIYRACMESGEKLRKALGKEYQVEYERIQKRNS